VRPPGLAIDVGRGTPRLGGVHRVLITHGHLDHALGLPHLLSLRSGQQGPPLDIICPAAIEGAVVGLIRAAEVLDTGSYRYRVRGVEPGETIDAGQDLRVEAFATDHVVPSLGYHLIRRRRRLREELREMTREEIIELRRANEVVEEESEEIWLSCTGDTGPGVFELAPELFESRVLVCECTFLLEEHRERAAEFKHMHLDDLVSRRDQFKNEALVLYHLSRRHRPDELRTAVRARLEPLAPEVHLVG
jgi:ribonuclease Z